MAKKRHEHKQEEKIAAMRERTSAMREKEKVHFFFFWFTFQQRLNSLPFQGYHGYAPAVGQAEVWLMYTTLLPMTFMPNTLLV